MIWVSYSAAVCKLWLPLLTLAACMLTWSCLWTALWVHPSFQLFLFTAYPTMTVPHQWGGAVDFALLSLLSPWYSDYFYIIWEPWLWLLRSVVFLLIMGQFESFGHRCGANSASKAWCFHLFFIVFVIICLTRRLGSSASSVSWVFVVLWWWWPRSSSSASVPRTIMTVRWSRFVRTFVAMCLLFFGCQLVSY
jgi:hypothetical protein